MGETEKEAVIKVANEFFPVDPTDGLRHSSRADRETLKARARVDSARENGKKGGRPAKPSNNPTLSDPVNPNETQTLTGTKAHHTPHAIEEQRSKAIGQQAARDTAPVKSASRFAEFWSAYPVKKGRAEAEAKWKARSLDAIADTIIADVKRRQAEDRQWRDPQYIPHGSTYVNGRGWEDAIDSGRGAANSETPDYLVGAI